MIRRILLTVIIAVTVLLAMAVVITLAFYAGVTYLGIMGGIALAWAIMAAIVVAGAWLIGRDLQLALRRREAVALIATAPLGCIWYPACAVLIVGLGLD